MNILISLFNPNPASEQSRLIPAIPVITLSIFIFSLSNGPLPTSVSTIPDWLMHSLCYALLATLAWIGLRGLLPQKSNRFMMIVSFWYAVVFGISDEWHQSFIPSRNASIQDLVSDTIGSGLAVMIIFFVLKYSTQKELSHNEG